MELLVTFEHSGLFMYHCHILEHEENGMMGQVNVVLTGGSRKRLFPGVHVRMEIGKELERGVVL